MKHLDKGQGQVAVAKVYVRYSIDRGYGPTFPQIVFNHTQIQLERGQVQSMLIELELRSEE